MLTEIIKKIKSLRDKVGLSHVVVVLAILIVGTAFSLTGASKYLLGSLLNGVAINTPTGSNHFAYGENIGWIDFNPANGNVQVGDNGLAGYAYGENVGWIMLGTGSPHYANTDSSNFGVNNDGDGNLSGFAYGENIGWISFSGSGYGVHIDTSTGLFSGYAYGENVGWISFSGTGYWVATDWRPSYNGACGTAANTSFAYNVISFGSYTLCSAGNPNPASPSFPAQGGSSTWSCLGINHGNPSGNCTAYRQLAPAAGVCGSASGQSFYTAPNSNLCSTGTASSLSGSGPWTWTCIGINGGATSPQCSATKSVNGVCGTANKTYTYSASSFSSDTFCSAGTVDSTPSFPASGSSSTWHCTGANGGTTSSTCTATRTATPVVGLCGSANGQSFSVTPDSNLCSSGNATSVSGSGPWTWTCSGVNGGASSSACTATVAPVPVVGVCGSANGQSFSTAPDSNLCSAGSATSVSGSGPWTWTCSGANGGASSSTCSASVTNTGGGGGVGLLVVPGMQNAVPINNSQSSVLDYIKQQLDKIRESIPNGQIAFNQPTKQPPANLQPVQPPPAKNDSKPTPTAANQNAVIQILQKIIKALQGLLSIFSKR